MHFADRRACRPPAITLGKRLRFWTAFARTLSPPYLHTDSMALWEYKIITSGKGGFASATMLESYINQLGRDEWEIIEFRTDPANPLAFNGLARRSTLREWTLEAAVAAAAKAEADKLRAELMHKQHAGDASASADSAASDKISGPDSLRQLRDTDRDHDPEALADEASATGNDWENLENFEDDLPVFFDAIKPHLRKNPNGAGQSVALNYLAKRWEQSEADLNGALIECGFVIPEHETDAPVYLDYEGELYWVEKNNRGQLFLNTREKPQPKFRVVQGKPLDPADPVHAALAAEQAESEAERARRAAEQAAREAEAAARRAEREAQRQAAEQARRDQQAAAHAAREAARAAAAQSAPPDTNAATAETPNAPAENPPSAGLTGTLPEGAALLDAVRPLMRRNRRGPGYSGSAAYLAKHFKVEESALRAALAAIGLSPAPAGGPRTDPLVVGAHAYWVNLDGGGGLWINGRDAGSRAPTPSSAENAASPVTPTSAADADLPAAPTGEAAVFRPVPRAMPPVPAPSPIVEAVPAVAPESLPATPSVPVPEPAPVAAAPQDVTAPVSAPALSAPITEPLALAALRGALKPNKGKTGVSASLSALAEATATPPEAVFSALVAQGLVAPPAEDADAKPVFVELDGEIFWLGRYAKDGSLWLNAKPARSAARRASSPRPRTKRRSADAIETDAAADAPDEQG